MTTLERIAYWTDQVERWETEGGSRRVFCEEHDIGYASFLLWCKRLRPDGITLDDSRVFADPSARFPARPSVSSFLIGHPVPSIEASRIPVSVMVSEEFSPRVTAYRILNRITRDEDW